MIRIYYNEFAPYPAQWLRNLVEAGHLPGEKVDERDIRVVRPEELEGYDRCHFFAGIGGWELALRHAGWPEEWPVWTGSCPCQPFSQIGKRKGSADERHLWPVWRDLIAEHLPPRIFGEQVAPEDGRKWLAGVRADLEGMGYRVGAADLCAAGLSAPHARQRLWWVAERAVDLEERRTQATGRMGDPDDPGPQGFPGNGEKVEQGPAKARPVPQASLSGHWDAYDLVDFKVGPQRRCPPGTHPVAHGVPAYVGMCEAYGNAIVPQVAAAFVASYMETLGCSR
jgi:DNA (cytosine-5)-methyltransferase 1